jgi:hypothetical protein
MKIPSWYRVHHEEEARAWRQPGGSLDLQRARILLSAGTGRVAQLSNEETTRSPTYSINNDGNKF